MYRIMMIEDDPDICELLQEYLQGFQMQLDSWQHPDQALREARIDDYDLLILDLMLPGRDGMDICREIRSNSDIPIIISSARSDVTDKVLGLEIGADDYLPKPYEPRELIARIQSVLRRTRQSSRDNSRTPVNQQVVRAGQFRLDIGQMSAWKDERLLELTTTEFELLQLFVTHPAQVLSRDFLMENLRGVRWVSVDRTIDVLISRLRAKIEDDSKHPQHILTVWGRGYKFQS